MIIKLSPNVPLKPTALSVSVRGEVLTINGEEFDFSVIPEGATLPAAAVACEFVCGELSRTGGVLSMTLQLPIGVNATDEQRFPADIVDPPDGDLVLPKDPPAQGATADE